MERPFLVMNKFWVVFILIAFQLWVTGCFGCSEAERNGLLELKASINYPNGISLPTWVINEDKNSSDCCAWELVECNSSTGYVIALYLSQQRASTLGQWYFNASLLVPFQQLLMLDLSYNHLVGWVGVLEGLQGGSSLERIDLSYNQLSSDLTLPYLAALPSLKYLSLIGNYMAYYTRGFSSEIFQKLSQLKKLEWLDLRLNRLDETVLPYLGAIKSLKYLYLADEEFLFDGSLGYRAFESWGGLVELTSFYLHSYRIRISKVLRYLVALPSLKELDICCNDFVESSTGFSPQDYHILSNFSKLEVLFLYANALNETILPFLGAIKSLKFLRLDRNNFQGPLDKGICNLINLQELQLFDNKFEGTLPSCLGNLTRLQLLDLGGNLFSGSIPATIITGLISIRGLILSGNRFSGSFPLSSLANSSKLEVIALDHVKVEFDARSPPWVPKFQLKLIAMSNCNIKNLNFLSNQYDLEEVDFSNNNLNGGFPFWLLGNNTRLAVMSFRNISLEGTFHLPEHLNKTNNLLGLQLSNNHIHGKLPQNFAACFPNLVSLDMSNNALDGSIPSSIGDLRRLEELDLSSNHLSGKVPKQLFDSCISLKILILSNNRLHGDIYPAFSNLSRLGILELSNNQFTGVLPQSLFNTSNLEQLDVGQNNLSGGVPPQIGQLSSLEVLILRENHFEGQISSAFCKLTLLDVLDLSGNKLSGSIPTCFRVSTLKYLHVSKNRFSGAIPRTLLNSPNLMILNLGYNNFVGGIPNWIGGFSDLSVLILKGNDLDGRIPNDLCQLNKLQFLDLSSNNLSGTLPKCIHILASGKQKFNASRLFNHSSFRYMYYFPNNYGFSLQLRHVSMFLFVDEQQEVEFVTKGLDSKYKGDILNYMSGIDLSCNHFTGEIPSEMGQLSMLHALNLSNNQFTGLIPASFGNLKEIESLDLSHNKLHGTIPSALTELDFLQVFKVGYNNLSGRIPQTRHFDTFGEDSYEGNPLLCGLPSNTSCILADEHHQEETNETSDDIDIPTFLASFFGSCCIFFIGTVVFIHYKFSNRSCSPDNGWRPVCSIYNSFKLFISK